MKLQLLLFASILLLASAAKTKEAATFESEELEDIQEVHYADGDEYDDSYREAKMDEHISKRKQQILDKNKDKKGVDDKSKDKEHDHEDPEDQPIEICDGTAMEACSCDPLLHEISCINIVFEDDTYLDSIDVALSTENPKLKNFEPLVARFSDNIIGSIRKNRVPEGVEESLASLHLDHNRISRIEARVFENYRNLSKLNLEHNRLRNIRAEWFAGGPETTLHQLNLKTNNIKETEKSPFRRLKNLRKLILDDNPIGLNEDTFVGLENLEVLSLDDCDIEKLPTGVFKPLKKLKKLSMRGNPFTEIPEQLKEVPHLDSLDLSETNVNEIHRASFSGEPELSVLYMTDMPYLAAIQDCAFCGLMKLKIVDFFNASRLSFIDENAFGFKELDDDRATALVDLKLSKTNISKVSSEMLEYESMERLDLGSSPLNCTCDMMYLKNIKFASGESHNGRCMYPKEIKGKYLEQVQVKEFCGNRYSRGYRFLFALFGAITAAIIITAGFVLFNRGYRFTNIRNIPLPSMPGANSAYTNLNRQEMNEMTEREPATPTDSTPDFQPRPAAV